MSNWKIEKRSVISNMSNGLLAMYIFLAVFATGLVIYSKMSDRKRQEK